MPAADVGADLIVLFVVDCHRCAIIDRITPRVAGRPGPTYLDADVPRGMMAPRIRSCTHAQLAARLRARRHVLLYARH